MNKYDIAIIGGGFSGMCLAAMLNQNKVGKVVVLEANKRLGKKILVTGNGQGNITNTVMDASHYHGDREFASDVICRYGNKSLLEFFSSLGLLTAERDGKIYPASFAFQSQSWSIYQVFTAFAIIQHFLLKCKSRPAIIHIVYSSAIYTYSEIQVKIITP